MPGDAIGHIQSARHHHLPISATIAVDILQGVDHVLAAGTHVQHPLFAQRHRPRIGDIIGIQTDAEARWQFNIVQPLLHPRGVGDAIRQDHDKAQAPGDQ